MADPAYRSSLDPPGSLIDEHALSGGQSLVPMELEEEMDSLIHETGDFTGVISKLTHRKKYNADGTAREPARASTGFRGLLRTKTAFTVRNAIFLGCLAWLVLLFVGKMGRTVNDIENNNMSDQDPRGPHQSSFGGIKNVGQVSGAKAHQKHGMDEQELAAWIDAEDNSGEGVKSVSSENILNHNGHYWHDPFQSPFASHLYKRTPEELSNEQKEFEMKMNDTKKMWGTWLLIDNYYAENGRYRPKPDFKSVKHRDLPIAHFPEGSWQTDDEYVCKFVDQARAMIKRVKEGIYAEYGHPTVSTNGTKLSGKDIEDRDALFQVIIEDNQIIDGKAAINNITGPLPGIAYMSRNAWDGLVRKLLHALVTNDIFYVVMAGDSVAAGHGGNNFMQTPVMQFHYLMEPVFDFLGMKLISRNMAMGFADTTLSALGGADIYGEADIMWYYAGRKAETQGQLDFFHKQAILSGERVPVLLTPDPVNIEAESNRAAWVGNLQPGAEICELSQESTYMNLIDACRLVNCDHKGFWPCEEFNSVCWVDRMGVDPPIPQEEYIRVPRGAKVPGPRKNKLEARKLSMLILHALDAAFDKWVAGIEAKGIPLAEDYWHVGDLYDTTREAVRIHIPRFYENVTECDALFKDFPIVCHVEMHAFTECTPRVNPSNSSLSNAIYPTMERLDFEGEELYADIDILPLQWKVPLNQTDVHAIAISTAVPPVLVDDDGDDVDDDYVGDDTTWIDDNDDVDNNGDNNGDAQPSDNNNTGGDGDESTPPRRAMSDHKERLLSIPRELKSTALRKTSTASSNEAITPGKGWMVWNHIPGFCDGSAQSTCNRGPKNTCLLAGHNDFPGGILGDALSGWLMLQIKHVKEGIILARLDTSVQPGLDSATEGWTSVDQGKGENNSRQLNIPADFEFDYAINGKVTTLLRSEFLAFGTEIVKGMTLYPLLMDESLSKKQHRGEKDEGETIDVAIRIRSAQGRAATILLSHLYYA